jgi:hypothetical protein
MENITYTPGTIVLTQTGRFDHFVAANGTSTVCGKTDILRTAGWNTPTVDCRVCMRKARR